MKREQESREIAEDLITTYDKRAKRQSWPNSSWLGRKTGSEMFGRKTIHDQAEISMIGRVASHFVGAICGNREYWNDVSLDRLRGIMVQTMKRPK